MTQHAHPIVQLSISDDFKSISFMGEENLIQLGDTLVLITSILQKFYHTLGQVKVSVVNNSNNNNNNNSSANLKTSKNLTNHQTMHQTSTISYYLPSQYIQLIFDYPTQRLIQINLSNVNKLIINHRGKYFTNPKQALAPTLKEIDGVFGSTKPGKIDPEKRNQYVLEYDKKYFDEFTNVLKFVFIDPLEVSSSSDNNNNNNNNNSINTTKSQTIKVHNKLICNNISLTSINSNSESLPSSISLKKSLLSNSCNILLDKLTVSKAQTSTSPSCSLYFFKFHLISLKPGFETLNESQKEITEFTREIKFNNKIQNVESELGRPNEIFYKSEHEHNNYNNNSEALTTDFYYNYYNFGLDILFSGQTKTVKKVILHTCCHEHEEFARRYSPCNFEFKHHGLSSESKFGDEVVQGMIGKFESDVENVEASSSCLVKEASEFDGNLMLLSRNNQVSDTLVNKSLISITGSSKNSGFLYHSGRDNEIYEFTSSGRLAMVTIY